MGVNKTVSKAKLDAALANGTIKENDITFVKDTENYEGIVVGNGNNPLRFHTVPSPTSQDTEKILQVDNNGIPKWNTIEEKSTFDGSKTITENLNLGGSLNVTDAVTAKSMTLTSAPVSDSNNMSVPTTSWANNRICTNAYKKALYVQSTNKTLTVTELLSASYIIISGSIGSLCTLTFPTALYKKGYVFEIDIQVLSELSIISIKRSDKSSEFCRLTRGSSGYIGVKVRISGTTATAESVQMEVVPIYDSVITYPSASTASLLDGDDASVMEDPSQDEQI